MLDESLFQDKTVLVTGHTGFKAAWLCTWLTQLGARVVGFGLPPETRPNAFEAVCLDSRIDSVLGDVRDAAAVFELFDKHAPEIVFHMAAQPLVRRSYRDPVETFATNALGTAHVLEAARRLHRKCAVVVVTTDKCYENTGSRCNYRESDPLGGHDPYSASKACAELITGSYRRSYFSDGPVFVASVRAGNVIGGGDWSEDRLVPDVVRAVVRRQAVHIRNPAATRPWQHVLEPLRGYLTVAERLWTAGSECAEAWNFGPDKNLHVTVKNLVQRLVWEWGEGRIVIDEGPHPYEASYLELDSGKAHSRLGWQPVLDFEQTVALTVEWYKQYCAESRAAADITAAQLSIYRRQVAKLNALADTRRAAEPAA